MTTNLSSLLLRCADQSDTTEESHGYLSSSSSSSSSTPSLFFFFFFFLLKSSSAKVHIQGSPLMWSDAAHHLHPPPLPHHCSYAGWPWSPPHSSPSRSPSLPSLVCLPWSSSAFPIGEFSSFIHKRKIEIRFLASSFWTLKRSLCFLLLLLLGGDWVS